MKRVYVAHPYSGKDKNKQAVEDIIRKLVKENPDILYISPIHTMGYLYNDVNYDHGMEYCFELLKTCDELLLCEGWETSKGCNIEKEFAEKQDININYYKSETEDVKRNKKYKIIGVSNFGCETVSDVLIADNLNEYFGKKIVEFLQNSMCEHHTYFPKLVEQDYKLYEWQP